MEKFILKAVFKKDSKDDAKTFKITEDVYKNEAIVNLGLAKDLCYNELLDFVIKLPKQANRKYTIDLDTFVTKKHTMKEIIELFSYGLTYGQSKSFTLKTSDDTKIFDHEVFSKDLDKYKNYKQKGQIIADAVNRARYYQAMSPNIANSEFLAREVEVYFKDLENVTIKTLQAQDMFKLGMNLMLSVNKGSLFQPRVVIIEYTGNPHSNQKTVLVGKGITFDSGGYSLKSKKGIIGMKYDMTGSMVAAFSLEAIARLKPKANYSAVLMFTDNRVNADASLPDNIYKSMNGKTVEVNNTDAEGRLVLADGMTYAIRNLNASRLIDIATLTGAIYKALGDTYVGVFSTSDAFYNQLQKASKLSHELIWRMPMDEEFASNIKSSKVADLKNSDLSGLAGSCSAAMFLNEFREDKDLIHLDIAGVAKKNDYSTVPMIKTLVELALNEK